MGDLWQRLLDNLHALWPYRIVDIDEQGVRFTNGIPVLLATGGHWFCAGVQRIEKVNVRYQEVDCLIQSMETKDSVSVTFSANVGYVITDAVAYLTNVQDFDGTLERRARGVLGEIVEENDLADLRGARKRLADRAQRQLVKLTAEWGVEIQAVSLTDFVRTPGYRLFGSSGIAGF